MVGFVLKVLPYLLDSFPDDRVERALFRVWESLQGDEIGQGPLNCLLNAAFKIPY